MASLADLRELYEEGIVTEPLLLDNDEAYAYDRRDMMVFEMHPQELLEEALKLLGIPYERV